MPGAVVQHPRLVGDRLDDVVPVEALQRLEVVIRPARAAGAPHVDVDDREAEQVGHRGDTAVGALGVGVAVAGVLDQGRVRAAAAGKVHVDGQPDAVAHRDVAVTAGRDALVVDPGARRPRSAC